MKFLNLALTYISMISLSGSSFAALAEKDQTEAILSRILIKMESPAEDMLEEIYNKNTENLDQLFNKLRTSMIELNQYNGSKTISDTQSKNVALKTAWFNLISTEIRKGDNFPALAYAINQFAGQLIITTEFKHGYDKNIAWMDYLGRELVLLIKHPNLNKNKDLIDNRKKWLQRTWDSLNVLISKTHDGFLLTQRVDLVINNIMLESQADKIISLSEAELESVDDIEKYFYGSTKESALMKTIEY